MTRTTNARIAGFTYLFYAAIGIGYELLMHQATGVEGDAAKLERIGQYATNVRLTILIALLECLSSFVLAVTLYGITRDEDHELAMLGLVCRVAEGVLGSVNNIPSYLGLLWLAKARVADGCAGHPHNERAAPNAVSATGTPSNFTVAWKVGSDANGVVIRVAGVATPLMSSHSASLRAFLLMPGPSVPLERSPLADSFGGIAARQLSSTR